MAAAGTAEYESFLKSLPTEQLQNFLTACRVFFDNAAQALREVCKSEQRDCGLPLPTTNLLGSKGTSLSLLDIEFSALAKHLYDGKHRAEKYSGSFFMYLFEAKWLAATDGKGSLLEVLPQPRHQQGRKSVDVASFDWSQLVEHKVYTHSQVSSMERLRNRPNQFHLLRPRDSGCKTVHVYLTTPHWVAVHKLKDQRNKYVAHNSSAALNNSDLMALFDDVKECYRILDVSKDIYKQLEEIEREHKMMQSAEEIFRDLLKYQQVVMNEWTVMDQRLDKVEGEVADVIMKVEHVEEEIAGVKEDITGLREEVRDGQARQTEGLEKLKDEIDHVRSSQTKGDTSYTLNVFGGSHNTFNVQQNFVAPHAYHHSTTAASSQQTRANPWPPSQAPPQICSASGQGQQFAPGQPSQDEITTLSEKIIQSPWYSGLEYLNKALKMDACRIASIQDESDTPYAQVSSLLHAWVADSPENNRTKLYELLKGIKLSSLASLALNK